MAIAKVYSESQRSRTSLMDMTSRSGQYKEISQRHDRDHFFKPKFVVVIREPDNSFVLGYN